MSAPYLGAKVIANWQPSELEYCTVFYEFSDLMRKLCGDFVFEWTDEETVGIRENGWRNQGTNLAWHRDNWDDEENIWVVVWTNRLPTEVLRGDGTLLSAKDGDVILLDNARVQHRTPPSNNTNYRRWFARAMIAKRREHER